MIRAADGDAEVTAEAGDNRGNELVYYHACKGMKDEVAEGESH